MDVRNSASRQCGAIIRKADHTPTIKEPIAPKRHVGVMILATAVTFVLLINISVAILLIRNGSKTTDDGETVDTHRT